jgi:hypothetical protein
MDFNFQIVPVHGLSLGVIYYNPNIDQRFNNLPDVEEEDYFERITFMFLIFGIHITWF